MNASFYQRAAAIFNAVRRAKPDDRERVLAHHCADDGKLRSEVMSLMRFHEQTLGASETDAAAPNGTSPNIEPNPRRISKYRVLGLIGLGGMGEVYLAEQEDPVRRVALKVLRTGGSSRDLARRFRNERQALALLNHPGIAQFFDAGTADDGTTFVAMEYVEGLPITEYCRTHRLDIDQRLELLAMVCDAVHAAHQRGVIHRDLKPGNIIVAAPAQDGAGPRPKVIDFGIAKAVSEEAASLRAVTREGQIVGTPAYMSPEQVGSPESVDTRSDVHSLGVLLYELLTGSTPFETPGSRTQDPFETLRRMRDTDPERPSDRVLAGLSPDAASIDTLDRIDPRWLSRRLRGELDAVVLKCLEKDPARRYASAAEVAGDVRRHLHHEPITARAPTLAYTFRKLVRRHRATAAGVLVAGCLILSAMIVTLVLYERARSAEVEARRGQRRAERALGFLGQTYDTLGRVYERDPSVTIRDTLRLAATRVDAEFADEPVARAEVRILLARALGDQQMSRAAESELRQALADLEPLPGDPDSLLVRSRARAALALRLAPAIGATSPTADRLSESLTLAAGAVADQDLAAPHAPSATLDVRLTQARCLAGADLPAARSALQQLVLERVGDSTDPSLAVRAWALLAQVLGCDPSERTRAEECWQRGLQIAQSKLDALGAPRLELVIAYANTLIAWREFDRANELAAQSAADIVKVQAQRWHPSYAPLLMIQERALLAAGKLDNAKEIAVERASGNKIAAWQHLAMIALEDLHDAELAHTFAQDAVTQYERQFPDAPGTPPFISAALAWSLIRLDRCDEARPLIRRMDRRTRPSGNIVQGERFAVLPVLIEFAKSCGEPDLADRWQRELAQLKQDDMLD
ncbi:MAG: serine/threonine-protein kinase [Phycisphaerales bacterium]